MRNTLIKVSQFVFPHFDTIYNWIYGSITYTLLPRNIESSTISDHYLSTLQIDHNEIIAYSYENLILFLGNKIFLNKKSYNLEPDLKNLNQKQFYIILKIIFDANEARTISYP